MKTKKEIQKKALELKKKALAKYDKETKKTKKRDTYSYGQYLVLKWVLGDSTIK